MIGCLQVVRIYIFMNERKLYIHSSYLYYFSLLSRKKIIFKRNKTCSPCLHSLVETLVKFVRFLEQVQTFDCVSGFD